MEKKAPAGRVPEKKKTEKIMKKIKVALTSSSRSGRKRKEAKAPLSPKKASQKKVRLKASTGKAKVRKKEEPEKKKKKTVQEVSPKKEKPFVKKVGTKKKEKAVSKKVKTIAARKTRAQLTGKEKAAKKEKPEKPAAKATTEKKPPLLVSRRKSAVPKPAVKPLKKAKVAAGAKAEIKKRTERRKKPLIAKRKKAALPEEIKKEKVMDIFRPEVTGKEKKRKAVRTSVRRGLKGSGSPKKEEAKEVGGEKKLDSAEEGTSPPASFETLPSDYGENSIHLIAINPQQVFAFWEVREDTLKKFQGALTLRQYDITNLDLNPSNANTYVDREVSERAGALYLDVEPAKDYIAEIGILYAGGIFITISRSHKVSTPHITTARSDEFESPQVTAEEEVELPEKHSETEMRAGYSGSE